VCRDLSQLLSLQSPDVFGPFPELVLFTHRRGVGSPSRFEAGPTLR